MSACVSSVISWSPKAQFEARNEASNRQNILLTINQVDLFNIFKLFLKSHMNLYVFLEYFPPKYLAKDRNHSVIPYTLLLPSSDALSRVSFCPLELSAVCCWLPRPGNCYSGDN